LMVAGRVTDPPKKSGREQPLRRGGAERPGAKGRGRKEGLVDK